MYTAKTKIKVVSDEDIELLQNNLKMFRMASGMTQNELGECLGYTITKTKKGESCSMTHGFENKHIKINQLQYLGIEKILKGRECELVNTLFNVFIDDRDSYTDETRECIKDVIYAFMPGYYSKLYSYTEAVNRCNRIIEKIVKEN